MPSADRPPHLINPYANQPDTGDDAATAARIAGRALVVGTLGIGAATALTGTGLADEWSVDPDGDSLSDLSFDLPPETFAPAFEAYDPPPDTTAYISSVPAVSEATSSPAQPVDVAEVAPDVPGPLDRFSGESGPVEPAPSPMPTVGGDVPALSNHAVAAIQPAPAETEFASGVTVPATLPEAPPRFNPADDGSDPVDQATVPDPPSGTEVSPLSTAMDEEPASGAPADVTLAGAGSGGEPAQEYLSPPSGGDSVEQLLWLQTPPHIDLQPDAVTASEVTPPDESQGTSAGYQIDRDNRFQPLDFAQAESDYPQPLNEYLLANGYSFVGPAVMPDPGPPPTYSWSTGAGELSAFDSGAPDRPPVGPSNTSDFSRTPYRTSESVADGRSSTTSLPYTSPVSGESSTTGAEEQQLSTGDAQRTDGPGTLVARHVPEHVQIDRAPLEWYLGYGGGLENLRTGRSVPVGEGSTNRETYDVQRALHGFYTGTYDGEFGPNTRTAVERFQRQEGLPVDGVVGPTTARRMIELRQKAKEEFNDYLDSFPSY
jgi:peptidoglycan hydrolase-like protein with peptidoglycan-binding domain